MGHRRGHTLCAASQAGTRNSLASHRGSLDKGQGSLQCMLHSVHLRPVQARQVWRREFLWKISFKLNIMNSVPQYAVVDVWGHCTFIL